MLEVWSHKNPAGAEATSTLSEARRWTKKTKAAILSARMVQLRGTRNWQFFQSSDVKDYT
jgi:hypothetical protein